MLETASLILIIIQFGKFLEVKAKASIIGMTEKLFPRDELLQYNKVKLVTIKNKSYKFEKIEEVESALLEKDDYIKIKAPFKLLVDCMVVNVTLPIMAIDQVTHGWDD